jgi:hypothetical protein
MQFPPVDPHRSSVSRRLKFGDWSVFAVKPESSKSITPSKHAYFYFGLRGGIFSSGLLFPNKWGEDRVTIQLPDRTTFSVPIS